MIDWIVAAVAAISLFLASNGFQTSHIIAGFFGSVVRSFVAKTGTLWQNLFGGFIGSIIAAYVTPLIAYLFSIADAQTLNSVAFGVGLLGMYFAEALLLIAKDYAKNPAKMKEDLRDLLLRFLNRKSD